MYGQTIFSGRLGRQIYDAVTCCGSCGKLLIIHDEREGQEISGYAQQQATKHGQFGSNKALAQDEETKKSEHARRKHWTWCFICKTDNHNPAECTVDADSKRARRWHDEILVDLGWRQVTYAKSTKDTVHTWISRTPTDLKDFMHHLDAFASRLEEFAPFVALRDALFQDALIDTKWMDMIGSKDEDDDEPSTFELVIARANRASTTFLHKLVQEIHKIFKKLVRDVMPSAPTRTYMSSKLSNHNASKALTTSQRTFPLNSNVVLAFTQALEQHYKDYFKTMDEVEKDYMQKDMALDMGDNLFHCIRIMRLPTSYMRLQMHTDATKSWLPVIEMPPVLDWEAYVTGDHDQVEDFM